MASLIQMIKFEGISKSFSDTTILKNISLSIDSGKTFALLGLSGSGKTTLLKLICGLTFPDTGSVTVDGMLVNPQNLKLIREKIGYVIQDGGLFPHLTARQNIALVGEKNSLSRQTINERMSELSLMTKITNELLDKYPRELSGGQRQRIGIMRALFSRPSILLLDEPLGALDPITRQDLQNEFKELFKRLNKTVILVTHDVHEAITLADNLVILDSGKVIQSGDAKEILERPANEFVRRFLSAQHVQVRSEAT